MVAKETVRAMLQDNEATQFRSNDCVSPCPWCGFPVNRIERGGHTREFCSKSHKTAYNNALSKLSIICARLIRTSGALKTWAQGGVNPSPNAEDGSQRPLDQ